MIEHDDKCEREPGYFLCHCAKRERLARGVTELPSLAFQYPICTGCWMEAWHDGNSLRCDNCHVTWAVNANDGDEAKGFWDDYDDSTGTLEEYKAKWNARRSESSDSEAER